MRLTMYDTRSIQKSIVFPNVDNEQLENKIKESMPFTMYTQHEIPRYKFNKIYVSVFWKLLSNDKMSQYG